MGRLRDQHRVQGLLGRRQLPAHDQDPGLLEEAAHQIPRGTRTSG